MRPARSHSTASPDSWRGLNQVEPTIMYRFITLLCACLLGGNAMAETAIKFSNDWRWEGPHSWLLMAKDDGYFKEEGLNVTLEPGKGSVQAIPPCRLR